MGREIKAIKFKNVEKIWLAIADLYRDMRTELKEQDKLFESPMYYALLSAMKVSITKEKKEQTKQDILNELGVKEEKGRYEKVLNHMKGYLSMLKLFEKN